MMRVRNAVVVTIGIGLFAVAYVSAAWLHPRVVAARQISNWAELHDTVTLVDAYHESHGAYPRALSLAIPDEQSHKFARYLDDSYGHPLFYESDGQGYLLASFGRDGVRDREGYRPRNDDTSVDPSPCFDEDIDTVYSSYGVRQLCGK